MTPDLSNDHRRERVLARSTIPAALDRVKAKGIMLEVADADSYSLAGGQFFLWPATGYWRSADGNQFGYSLTRLLQTVAKANEPKPATPVPTVSL